MSRKENESDDEFQTRIFKRGRALRHWTLGGVLGVVASIAVILQAKQQIGETFDWTWGVFTAPSDIKQMKSDIHDIKKYLKMGDFANAMTNRSAAYLIATHQVTTNQTDP